MTKAGLMVFGVFVSIFLLGIGLLGGDTLGKAGQAKERPLPVPDESRPPLRCAALNPWSSMRGIPPR